MKVQVAPRIEKQAPGMHYGAPTAYATTLPLMGGNRLEAPHGFVIPLNLPILSSRGGKSLRTLQTPAESPQRKHSYISEYFEARNEFQMPRFHLEVSRPEIAV